MLLVRFGLLLNLLAVLILSVLMISLLAAVGTSNVGFVLHLLKMGWMFGLALCVLLGHALCLAAPSASGAIVLAGLTVFCDVLAVAVSQWSSPKAIGDLFILSLLGFIAFCCFMAFLKQLSAFIEREALTDGVWLFAAVLGVGGALVLGTPYLGIMGLFLGVLLELCVFFMYGRVLAGLMRVISSQPSVTA